MLVINKNQCVPVDDKFGYVVIRQDLSLAFQASLDSFYLFARKDGPVAGRITSQSKDTRSIANVATASALEQPYPSAPEAEPVLPFSSKRSAARLNRAHVVTILSFEVGILQ